MKNNPKNDWSIEDLKSVAQKVRLEFRQPGTSHVTFSSKTGFIMTVPARRPIKPIYVKKFVEFVELLKKE